MFSGSDQGPGYGQQGPGYGPPGPGYGQQPPPGPGYGQQGPGYGPPQGASARARPLFPGNRIAAANAVRGYWGECCCGLQPGLGPNVPPHWLDGGDGWATAHFFDIQPFDPAQEQAGQHQCKYCTFVADGESFGGGPCWCPCGAAPEKMVAHLAQAHGITAPPLRQWATECCDTDGCCDVWLCFQCQAARQINASHGYADNMNCCWCLIFSCCTMRHREASGKYIHLHMHFLAAFITRNSIKELNRIDEGCCTTLLMALCCPCCSLAQTYREFSAGGVWPGGFCNGGAPSAIAMNDPTQNTAQQPQLIPPVPVSNYDAL